MAASSPRELVGTEKVRSEGQVKASGVMPTVKLGTRVSSPSRFAPEKLPNGRRTNRKKADICPDILLARRPLQATVATKRGKGRAGTGDEEVQSA